MAVIAWVSGPWAAAQLSVWLIIPALLILMGLPSVFSTRGNKRQIIVATPGPLRVLLEIMLHVVAAAGAWLVWLAWAATAATLCVLLAIALGVPRTKWLLRGAPPAATEIPLPFTPTRPATLTQTVWGITRARSSNHFLTLISRKVMR